jgi:hypothetical protein
MCLGEGAPEIFLTSQLLDSTIEGGSEIPVCPATQGGTVTMLDVEVAGLSEEEITSVRGWITAEGMGTVADSTWTASVFGQLATCRETDTLGVTNLPILYSDNDASALDGLAGTLHLDIRGVEPYSLTYDIQFRAIGGC